MKILTAIANFGTKNTKYVQKLLREYRSMSKHDVDIVVLSDIPKDFGSDIEVIVGLPTKNPWSLPFRHKTLFAERVQQYDLFIYSEDDTLITERNIESFLEVTQILPATYVAGFMRYEISPTGKKYYSTIHSYYHWDPNSVLKIGKYIFAHYTNEHSACFLLSQSQLKRAIASGGFLLPPRTGRYDMLVTAATDPYTQCGMKKVICISHFNDFCLHHLPNVYCGKIGIDAELADNEIQKLKSLDETARVRGPLFDTSTKLKRATWDKKYYEPSRKDILSLIPPGVSRVLSVGCACGSTESDLVNMGIEVTGIPLDCVIQESAAAKGVKLLPPSLQAAIESRVTQYYDCILFPDVLHHLPNPTSILRLFCKLLREDGFVLISVPNFNYPSVMLRTLLQRLDAHKPGASGAFGKYGLHFTTEALLNSWLRAAGLKAVRFYRQSEPRYKFIDRLTFGALGKLLSRNIVVLTRRASP
jgi:SAM-dependent methyltransferase